MLQKMASTIVFVSLLMAFSLTESSALTNTINRDTEPPTEIKSHKWGFDADDISGRNHFADFLRALYAPAKDGPSPTTPTQLANDMANELMPISSLADDEHDDDLHNRDLEQHAEFPTDSTGQLPILKKRNSRYCGSYLADALQMVCRSSYLPLFGKRSIGMKSILLFNILHGNYVKLRQVIM